MLYRYYLFYDIWITYVVFHWQKFTLATFPGDTNYDGDFPVT